MSLLGHNNGPTLEAGFAWRKHSWAKARKELLPNLPIEILRGRVKRAKALGLPYKTYASVRAASGHDVVGFLFSNNALRMLNNAQSVPLDRVEALKAADAAFVTLVHRPVDPGVLSEHLSALGIAMATGVAPHFADAWSEIAARVKQPLIDAKLPRDGVLVIGDTDHERDWSTAGKLAGYLRSDQYFGAWV
ncbi:hypothetical protein N9M66_04030 [Litoreibacter sp.]|nr:hypothetical protein [Litoreibacter sp.]